MADDLVEYKNKLQKSKQQLKKVKQLLTQQPQNENLLQLKRDLEEVITVTETLIHKKKEKSFDEKHHSNSQSSHPSSHVHTNTNTLSNPGAHPMFVSSQPLPSAPEATDNAQPSTPPEWGEQKEEYDVGERCQIKWQNKWLIGRICGIASHSVPVEYTVMLIQKHYEVTVPLHDIRTYVPPLPSQLHIGLKINAIWHRDERFYPAIIEEILHAEYKIKFERYNEYASVPLCDIQLLHKKEHLDRDGFNHNVVKKNKKTGQLLITEKAVIPSGLWSKDDDTPDLREKKRKKIKSIKRNHRDLKMEVESKNRANSWQQFKSKNFKKHSKKMKNSLLTQTQNKKSIFDNPTAHTNASIIETNANMTQFTQRTHFHHLKKAPSRMEKKL